MKLRDWIDINNLDLYYLSINPNAIDLLKENKNYINWSALSYNINAIEILKENLHKINWFYLSSNPNVIEILKDNLDKINWDILSCNPNAIDILKENPNKINWVLLSSNPSIFTYDYNYMKKSFIDLKEEIIAKALHPKIIFKLIEEYGEEYIYDIYFED